MRRRRAKQVVLPAAVRIVRARINARDRSDARKRREKAAKTRRRALG